MCVVCFVLVASSNHHHYYDHDDDHHYHHRSVERNDYVLDVPFRNVVQSSALLGPLRGGYYKYVLLL